MTFRDWASLRGHAIHAFNGETPHPMTEQVIIDAYELHPDAVHKAIDQVAADHANGAIRSGWGILKHRAEAILHPPSNPTAKTGRHAEKQAARAEQWIRNAGKHYDRWDEAADDLANRNLPATEDLHDLWNLLRPDAALIELQAVQRGRDWIRQQAALAAAVKAKRDELDAAQTQTVDEDFAPVNQ